MYIRHFSQYGGYPRYKIAQLSSVDPSVASNQLPNKYSIYRSDSKHGLLFKNKKTSRYSLKLSFVFVALLACQCRKSVENYGA